MVSLRNADFDRSLSETGGKMTDKAISVEGISFSYGKMPAVDNISFEVAPGEILGFLGPNGAGKSTTIKMLTGQLNPSAGEIHVLGKNIVKDRVEVQAEIGVCFEEKNLYLNMSARENLRFYASLFGIKDLDIQERLAQVGLADKIDDRPKDFSKGMRQRLMVARCLINTPKVLFLDEPTDGLDPVSAQTIRKLIVKEAKRGAAVLLTTHDMDEADKLSDRVAFINEGKIAATDTPENLKLEFGKRAIKIRLRETGGVHEETIAFDEKDAGERVKTAVASKDLLTIHTEEATLENIFIELTGRGLEG